MEQTEASRGSMPDWQSIRVFLTLQRSGSFRSAAAKLGLSVNSVRRRIGDLEALIGAPLMTRHVDGIRLTTEGQAILDAANRMEAAAFSLVRTGEVAPFAETGEVRIAVTEGLGAFWLAPRLVEFQRANPRLTVDLRCAMESADVLRLEADVAIQLTRPTSPDLRVVKLGRIHMVPYAGRSYVEDVWASRSPRGSRAPPDRGSGRQPDHAPRGLRALSAGLSRNGADHPEDQCQQRVLLGDREGRRDRPAADLCQRDRRAGRPGGQSRPLRRRHLADLSPGCGADRPRAADDRLVAGVLRSEALSLVPDEFIHPRDLPGAVKGEPLPDLFAGFIAMTS